eukprot:CAMPEP_0116881160 /NCGR_PEP_ID=MMETSP0463-20121206/13267_1 /TAXON_ID=181622 /ORGANISM="Strombidinopsis sp, Strain SopsisLIS2011" /LENGTH=110 /DNA_ID=CAMNT_0004532817 /DNA_START=1217 /DNA_END=1549 /DNA_ORIENTATION=-
MIISLASLFMQGEFNSRLYTPLYFMQYGLINFYMWTIAYLYSPNVDYSPTMISNSIRGLSSIFGGGKGSDKTSKLTEHDEIMGKFYEQELPEYSLEEVEIYDEPTQNSTQ